MSTWRILKQEEMTGYLEWYAVITEWDFFENQGQPIFRYAPLENCRQEQIDKYAFAGLEG